MAEEEKKTAEAKSKSLFDKVSDFLKNEDLQKGIKNIAEIVGESGLTQAQKEAKVKELAEKDKER
jgi:hypothetical protein